VDGRKELEAKHNAPDMQERSAGKRAQRHEEAHPPEPELNKNDAEDANDENDPGPTYDEYRLDLINSAHDVVATVALSEGPQPVGRRDFNLSEAKGSRGKSVSVRQLLVTLLREGEKEEIRVTSTGTNHAYMDDGRSDMPRRMEKDVEFRWAIGDTVWLARKHSSGNFQVMLRRKETARSHKKSA